MRRLPAVAIALLLLMTTGCGTTTGVGREDECPEGAACAPENPEPVPDVVGMRLISACGALSEAGYSGGVRRIIDDSGEPAGTILRLETEAGTKARQGQVIMMHVAGPLSLEDLPEGCVSRIPGTF